MSDQTVSRLDQPQLDAFAAQLAELHAEFTAVVANAANEDELEVQRKRAGLGLIEAAQDRIAAGTYGVCDDCGSAIPAERLEIMPTTKHCVQCQQYHEPAHL